MKRENLNPKKINKWCATCLANEYIFSTFKCHHGNLCIDYQFWTPGIKSCQNCYRFVNQDIDSGLCTQEDSFISVNSRDICDHWKLRNAFKKNKLKER